MLNFTVPTCCLFSGSHSFAGRVNTSLEGAYGNRGRPSIVLQRVFLSLPKKEKPRHVELYFSSWCIRAVQSPKQPGQQSACEVTLVHRCDMGIPKMLLGFLFVYDVESLRLYKIIYMMLYTCDYLISFRTYTIEGTKMDLLSICLWIALM